MFENESLITASVPELKIPPPPTPVAEPFSMVRSEIVTVPTFTVKTVFKSAPLTAVVLIPLPVTSSVTPVVVLLMAVPFDTNIGLEEPKTMVSASFCVVSVSNAAMALSMPQSTLDGVVQSLTDEPSLLALTKNVSPVDAPAGRERVPMRPAQPKTIAIAARVKILKVCSLTWQPHGEYRRDDAALRTVRK
ncbi:MAG TPA: hypothetical protein VGG17_06510 [Acidimicrobiales bacterium]